MFLRNGFKFAVFDSKQVSLSDYINLEQWWRIISISLDLQIQRYEGASTIYGPHTLEAFIQEFNKLADALAKVQYSNALSAFFQYFSLQSQVDTSVYYREHQPPRDPPLPICWTNS